MQDTVKRNEFVLLSVPTELADEVGIYGGEVLEMSAEHGRLIIEPLVDDDDFICDDDCENCPLADECEESEVR